MAAASLRPCGCIAYEQPQARRCMHVGALAPRASFSTRLLCFGKLLIYTPKRKAAKLRTGVEDLVSYCDCAHTKFEGKPSCISGLNLSQHYGASTCSSCKIV